MRDEPVWDKNTLGLTSCTAHRLKPVLFGDMASDGPLGIVVGKTNALEWSGAVI
jgi:hypothetical protein